MDLLEESTHARLALIILPMLVTVSVFSPVTTTTTLSSPFSSTTTTSVSNITTSTLSNQSYSTSGTLNSSFTTFFSKTSSSTVNRNLTPVVIIPGVAGSALLVNLSSGRCNPSPCKAWPFPTNATMTQMMALQGNGVSPSVPGSSIIVNGVLRSWPVNFYGTIIQNLTRLGYVENKTMFVFAYDWRMDLASDLPLLDNAVNNALTVNNASKVILIAHSMGGLIAQGYVLSSPARAGKVQSIISLGTPYWGSPLAYYTVVNGYTFGNPYVDPLQMKLLAQNMTSAYALFPRSPFITNVSSGSLLSLNASYSVVYKGVTGNPNIDRMGSWNSTIKNIWTMNQGRLNAAMNFWKLSGTPAAPAKMPVPLYSIIGAGFQTLSGYRMARYTGTGSFIELPNGTRVVMTPVFSDGDGTVPLTSAQISTATATYYIQNVPGTLGFGGASSAHGDLPKNPTALVIISQIIKGSPPPSSKYTMTSLASNSINFVLHSNALLSVTDINRTGYLGSNSLGGVDYNLSSGTYLNLDGVEYVSLQNTNDTYIVYANGTSTGQYDLSINFTVNGKTETITYPEVSVNNQTESYLEINPDKIYTSGAAAPNLTVNEPNGTRIELAPSNVSVSDVPESNATGYNDILIAGSLVSVATLFVITSILFLRKRGR